jgi:hypothetical protein
LLQSNHQQQQVLVATLQMTCCSFDSVLLLLVVSETQLGKMALSRQCETVTVWRVHPAVVCYSVQHPIEFALFSEPHCFWRSLAGG